MKRILFIAIAALLLTSCGDYVQVVYTAPINNTIKKDNSFWVYDNDTLRIIYSFWDQHGIMSFVIYNKSNAPIYIDWKKSAFINDEKRIPYYTGTVTRNYNYSSWGSSFGWANVFCHYLNATSMSSQTTIGSESIVKEERKTFIPPHSYIAKRFDNILGNIFYDIRDRNTKKSHIDDVPVYITTLNNGVHFRNYLTYSTSEDFDKESFVDNEFYIKKIVTMNTADFEGEFVGNTGQHEYPFNTPTRFYISDLTEDDLFPQQLSQATN